MNEEIVSMETVRISINSLISFEKELLEISRKKADPFGAYACEKAIEALSKALRTLEHYKVSLDQKEAV